MLITKKSFKVVYNLIIDGAITEKEAFNLVEGIFEQKILQIPVPIPQESQENPEEEPVNNVEVKGFAPLNN